MVKVENISKSYEKFSISSLSFNVEEGEFLSLLGQSGSGKTTLLNIISGQETKYTGTVKIENGSIKDSIKNGKIAMVFQDALLLPHLNIFENIVFGLRIKKVPKKEIEEKGMKILELLELTQLRDRFPNQLSGGQKQRVGIGRALIMEPLLLLMDEPFSALDGELREKLQKMLKKLQKDLKITIIFVTHDKEEAFYLSDTIIIMEDGKIIRKGTPMEIYSQPLRKNVANFLGMENIFTREEFGSFKILNSLEEITLIESNTPLKKNILERNINKNIFFILPSEKLEVVEKQINSENKTINSDDEKKLKGIIKEYVFKLGYFFIWIDINGKLITVRQNRLEFPIFLGKEILLKYSSKDIIFVTN